jgi:hypothetical protein
MLSNQKIESNWPSIKSQVLHRWNKLSESEVEKTHGDARSLGKLVTNKYGRSANFEKNYEKICNLCIPSSRNTLEENENSGLDLDSEVTQFDKTQPENPARATGYRSEAEASNLGKFNPGVNREAQDELSAYDLNRHSFNEYEDNIQFDTHYSSTPDEISQNQDPSASREDITLGRPKSSATNNSTAFAAPKSSVVSLSDTK